MVQPPGYSCTENPTKVCRLVKSLYGLKQAGRAWNIALDKTLRTLGFLPIPSDPCVYTMHSNGHQLILCIWVDDIISAACRRCHSNIQFLRIYLEVLRSEAPRRTLLVPRHKNRAQSRHQNTQAKPKPVRIANLKPLQSIQLQSCSFTCHSHLCYVIDCTGDTGKAAITIIA